MIVRALKYVGIYLHTHMGKYACVCVCMNGGGVCVLLTTNSLLEVSQPNAPSWNTNFDLAMGSQINYSTANRKVKP